MSAHREIGMSTRRSMLPQHPAGVVQVNERELAAATGAGEETGVQTTAWFCTLYTFLARCC